MTPPPPKQRDRVARYELHLRCAPPLNVYARQHWRDRQRIKAETLIRMLAQSGRWGEPLGGKPLIVIERRSVGRLDHESTSVAKYVLDCLKLDGLGLLIDDSPDHCDVEVRIKRVRRSAESGVTVEVFA